jgi:pilus assembly protein CpaD
MTIKNTMRVLSLFAVMLAGSCASPLNTTSDLYNPEQIHPITVTPSYETLKLSFSTREAGLMPDDEAHFTAFVQNYIAHGHGAISVSAPDVPGSQDTIHYFGDRIAEMGVEPSRILVGTHPAASGDTGVELGYVTYVAHADQCGDWTDDVSGTSSNLPTKNFGCATQHNFAAELADPRDLEEMRPLGPADATKRDAVIEKYQKGSATGSGKNSGQDGSLSGL